MNTNQETLLKVKRVLSFLTSIGLIGISIWFSKMGFGVESGNQYEWIGWFLGIVVMVVELVFNTSIQKLNPTLIGAGILSYCYGMYTNVIGLQDVLGVSVGFAIILGLFLEVLPEPLFAWAIGVTDGGDVIGNIGELFGKAPTRSSYSPSIPAMGFHKPEERKWVYHPINENKGKHSKPDSKDEKPWQKPVKHKGSDARKVANRIFHDKYVDKFKIEK